MAVYQIFIGVDISKKDFVVAREGHDKTETYENNPAGWLAFQGKWMTSPQETMVVLEATGGYEMGLLQALCAKTIAVHRADTRKVKHYIRACRGPAKTDALDAKALAYYGKQRHSELRLFQLADNTAQRLKLLVARRGDLVQMSVQEQNRAQGPEAKQIAHTYSALGEVIESELKKLDEEINLLISQDASLSNKKRIMQSVPGIGEKISNTLLAMMPELGTLGGKEIASLAGVAPHPRDSGTMRGYRTTKGNGRRSLRPLLFLAAMAARQSKSRLREFYEGLVARGKKPLVALTALMRKIITIINARIRDNTTKEVIYGHR